MIGRLTLLLLFTATLLFTAALARANVPPDAPIIIEPAVDGEILNAADVHMATAPFHDADGDHHLCSDFEIHDAADNPVWVASCATGPEKVHIHLGNGVFAGSRTYLDDDTDYTLHVRFRDDSGDPVTERSAWTVRPFHTAPALPAKPLSLVEVAGSPAPRLSTADGEEVIPPFGAHVALETVDNAVVLDLSQAAIPDQVDIVRGAPLSAPSPVRAFVEAGPDGWSFPESDLTFEDSDGIDHTIYFPAASLAANGSAVYWLSANGSTHHGTIGGRVPDFSTIVRGAPNPWTALQPGFVIDRLPGDYELPVNIAFVPHPSEDPDAPLYYVNELYGSIKVVTRSGEVRDYATNVLNFDPHGPFPGSGEIGLAGLAIEPESGDLIVTMPAADEEGQLYPRVARLHSEDGGLTASSMESVVDFFGVDQAASHQISNVTIGPDHKLYVHVGDANEYERSQDLSSLLGKILRLDLDGSPDANNPFYNPLDGIGPTDYILAYGLRNPFGGAWRAADGQQYEIENGPNLDRLAEVVAGRNYLYDGTDDSMRNYAICTFPGGTAPVNIDFVQKETFDGSGFPESKMDHAFISESGPTWASGVPIHGKRISEVALTPEGTLAEGPTPLIAYNGTGKASVVGIAAGPDGLYFTSLYKDWGYASPFDRGAAVFRVRWVGYADFALAFPGDALTVDFTDRSVVPDATSWKWDFGDGSTSDAPSPQHTYATGGAYIVRLTVTGPRGTVVMKRKLDIHASGSGLVVQYFDSPDMTGPSYTQSDANIDHDWGSGTPPGVTSRHFSARWTGRIRPRLTEEYRFIAHTYNQVRLMIDGKLILETPTMDPDGEVSGTITLEAGIFHDLVLEYVHLAGDAVIRLDWETDTQPREVVPPSVLFAPPTKRRRSVGR